ncbi:aspartate carbamoyltransferase regulatory subunit [Peptoniphilus koenoeneniae]|uniref:Aspartate carbamoyltransferase regulatory subunit n=1 Tax=Peptoniphilus koenoeneniae TaxID=507751 RepID=A0ABU0AXW7_9FIRM|nr:MULTISPECIES: aspartate carbamoyltransferase regulatory subunit [Peptoniphilus]ERT61865.1 aspartate carbamoyltransferase regulatory chain, allosteric domain / aspartate carbamoyltransferase regulatory chain, metal-binding domain multi-domain protein [Peptoniphilus sp. BV3C26]MDQ0275632.1 aspartate carbamoyltransferase regulatory subunit [Peptoniphilus koenoeneniae]
MINVSKIKKGIVLDHIVHGDGYKLYKALKLDTLKEPVVLMQNIPSSSLGRKDLIKIETDFDLDFAVLGLIAPHTTVNFIEDGNRIKKIRMELPEEVEGILKCKNPRCITNDQKVEHHKFYLTNPETKEYRCEYCDSLNTFEEL